MTSATVRIAAAKIVDLAAEMGKAAAKIEIITAKITNAAAAIRIKVTFIRIVRARIDTIAAVIGYFPGDPHVLAAPYISCHELKLVATDDPQRLCRLICGEAVLLR